MAEKYDSESDFPEEEEVELGEEDIEIEEEDFSDSASGKGIIVIDDQSIKEISEKIDSNDVSCINECSDIIVSYIRPISNIIFEEDNELDGIVVLVIPFVKMIYKLYRDGDPKKKAYYKKHLDRTVGLCNKVESFASSVQRVETFMHFLFIIRDYAGIKLISKTLSKFISVCQTKSEFSSIINRSIENFMKIPEYRPIIFKLRYEKFLNDVAEKKESDIESNLNDIIGFYTDQMNRSVSFTKYLIQELAKELSSRLSTYDKSILSWKTLGTLYFITKFIVKANEKRLLFPCLSIILMFLEHYPVQTALPFQIKLCRLAFKLVEHFNVETHILSWITFAMGTVCDYQIDKAKKHAKFDFVRNHIIRKDEVSIEYCEEAFDLLSRLFMAFLTNHCDTICFPEYSMFILLKLEDISRNAKNPKMRGKPKQLIKLIKEQQDYLIKAKKNLECHDRKSQIENWNKFISTNTTPIRDLLNRDKAVEERIEKMSKSVKSSNAPDDSSTDKVTIATVDDI